MTIFLIRKKWSLEGSRTILFKVLGERKKTPRILYQEKISPINESEIKTLTEEGKLKEYIANRPGLQELLKEVHQRERNDMGRKLGWQGVKKSQ